MIDDFKLAAPDRLARRQPQQIEYAPRRDYGPANAAMGAAELEARIEALAARAELRLPLFADGPAAAETPDQHCGGCGHPYEGGSAAALAGDGWHSERLPIAGHAVIVVYCPACAAEAGLVDRTPRDSGARPGVLVARDRPAPFGTEVWHADPRTGELSRVVLAGLPPAGRRGVLTAGGAVVRRESCHVRESEARAAGRAIRDGLRPRLVAGLPAETLTRVVKSKPRPKAAPAAGPDLFAALAGMAGAA